MDLLTVLTFFGIFAIQLSCCFTHHIELEKVIAFPEPNIIVFNSYKVRRVNRTTYALGGNMTFKVNMDDSIDLVVVANNWQGTTYNKIIDKKFVGICKSLYNPGFRLKYMKLKSVSNLPEHGTCPITQGMYAFENYLEEDKGQLPEYMPGNEKWKFDKMYYRGEKLLGGYSLYVVITKEVDDGNSTVSMLIRAPKNIPAGK